MQVNIYTMSSAKGIKRQDAKVGYILSTKTTKGEATKSDFKILENVTVNQAELKALIMALERITMKCTLHIYTESTYITNAVKNWMKNWKENEWTGAKGKSIANREEWIELDRLLEGQEYFFHEREEHEYRNWLKGEVNRKEKNHV